MKPKTEREDGEEKVVQPQEVEFGEVTQPQADSVSLPEFVRDPTGVLEEVEWKALRTLGQKTRFCFPIHETYLGLKTLENELFHDSRVSAHFAPFYLHIRYLSNCKSVLHVEMHVPQKAVLDFIVGSWGDTVKESGLLEDATLMGDNYDLKKAVKVFPELETVKNFRGGYINIPYNHFFPCYAVPDLKDRAFFAGAIAKFAPNVQHTQTAISDELVKGLETKQMFEYANEVGKVKEVSRLVQLYQSL